jgi:hypothetical protein
MDVDRYHRNHNNRFIRLSPVFFRRVKDFVASINFSMRKSCAGIGLKNFTKWLEGESIPLEEKSFPSEEKCLPLEEKSLLLKEKSLLSEEKSLLLEEKSLPLEEKCLLLEEKTLRHPRAVI